MFIRCSSAESLQEENERTQDSEEKQLVVIVEGRFPEKMASSSAAGAKRKKTPEEKAKHKATCVKSRLKIKNQNNQMREENKRMKRELEDKNSELQRIEDEMQKGKRALEEQKAKEAQMIQIFTGLKAEGQSFSSSGQMSNWLLSRTYEQNHQGLENPNIVSDPCAFLVANNIGFDAPNNNLFSCDLPAGPDNTNITASDPRLSFVANNIAFDAPNSNLSYPAAGLLGFGAGSSFHANDDDWIMKILKPDAAAGLLDSGAGSSHANDDDCLSAWIKEMSKPDAAAGISETKNLVVENQNNEMVNQIDHDAMVHRRELSPAQRGAENERDRQHMPEYNLELERPRNVETEYEEIAPVSGESQLWLRKVGNTISQFAEESKRINDIDPYLARKIQEVDNIVRQHVLLL